MSRFNGNRPLTLSSIFFLQNRSWVRWDPKPKIKDAIIKKNWDPSKSPAANLSEMGLLARPNQLDPTETATVQPSKSHVVELFDVPESDKPNRQTRFPLTEEEEEYMAKCMAKHGDNYTAMFRDIKTNKMQHTEDKLRKMGARYLLLSSEQRRFPVPERVQALLPDEATSDE